MFKFRVLENSYGHKKRLEFIVKQIEKYCLVNNFDKNQIRILDVGCGSGLLITLPLGSLGYEILGIDFDENSIKFANTQNIFKNIKFEKNTIENINGVYDIILACEILEHVEKPIEFLNTVKSKLKPNGIITLTTPNGYGWSEREAGLVSWLYGNKFLKRIFNKLKGHNQDITMNENDKHMQKFSELSIANIFKDSKLAIVARENGPVFGGPIVERTFARLPGFKTISNKLGDILPAKLVLVWYFVLKNY